MVSTECLQCNPFSHAQLLFINFQCIPPIQFSLKHSYFNFKINPKHIMKFSCNPISCDQVIFFSLTTNMCSSQCLDLKTNSIWQFRCMNPPCAAPTLTNTCHSILVINFIIECKSLLHRIIKQSTSVMIHGIKNSSNFQHNFSILSRLVHISCHLPSHSSHRFFFFRFTHTSIIII